MSIPSAPAPARLVIGLFMADKNRLPPLVGRLSEAFGPVELVSEWFSFHQTEYYRKETGWPLYRRMFSFSEPVNQEDLADIKLFTNALEAELAAESGADGRRPVNIDPGYLTAERFVLASGKNFTHRIYIGKGIYADLTLIYSRGDFRFLDWTYPDYREEALLSFLRLVRKRYMAFRR